MHQRKFMEIGTSAVGVQNDAIVRKISRANGHPAHLSEGTGA